MSEERKVSQLSTRANITGEEYMHVGFNGRSYKTSINAIISKFNSGINLEVLEEIRGKLDELADLGALVTVEELTAAIAAIPAVDLSTYATSEEVINAINEAITAIPAVDLSNIYNKQEIDQKFVDAGEGESIDLSGYATKVYVNDAISEFVIPDVTDYVKKAELPDVSGFITAEDIPAFPDLTVYAKVEDIPAAQDLSGLALKTELPDVSSFITAMDIPAPQDLSGFALKTELPDVSGFQTAEDVLTTITETAPDLSNFAEKSELPDVSGFLDITQVQQAITTALADTDDFVRTSANPIGRLLWVSGQASETQDGSIAAPFATIQQAVDHAAADNGSWTILCMPGSESDYTNDVTISGKSNILIQGWSAQGAHNVVIKGTVTITGATTTRIRLRDIAIRPVGNTPAIVFDGTQGHHYFMNVNAESTSGSTAPIIVYRNDEQHWTSFDSCDITGQVVIENTVNANLAVYFNGQNSAGCHLEINGDSNIFIRNGCQFGSVEHNAGNVEVKYVGTWTGNAGVAIKSTAADKRCYVAFCDFTAGASYHTLDGAHIVAKNCITAD